MKDHNTSVSDYVVDSSTLCGLISAIGTSLGSVASAYNLYQGNIAISVVAGFTALVSAGIGVGVYISKKQESTLSSVLIRYEEAIPLIENGDLLGAREIIKSTMDDLEGRLFTNNAKEQELSKREEVANIMYGEVRGFMEERDFASARRYLAAGRDILKDSLESQRIIQQKVAADILIHVWNLRKRNMYSDIPEILKIAKLYCGKHNLEIKQRIMVTRQNVEEEQRKQGRSIARRIRPQR
jgi:hypothetical protein